MEFVLETIPTPDVLLGFDAVFWGLDAGLPTLDAPEGESDGSLVTGGVGDSPIGWAYDGRRSATMIDRFLQGASLTAGRLTEGPQPTRLFVSTAGHQPLAAVHPADPAEGYSAEEARDEAARCLRCECLECVKVCTYLEHFGGYPRSYAREIYNNSSIVAGERKSNLLINSCMLCGLCTAVCPEDFSMPDLCLSARREMIGRGRMPPSAHEFALEDYTWSQSDAFALCRHEPGTTESSYAFYPGCQLAGSNPEQVEQRLRAPAWPPDRRRGADPRLLRSAGPMGRPRGPLRIGHRPARDALGVAGTAEAHLRVSHVPPARHPRSARSRGALPLRGTGERGAARSDGGRRAPSRSRPARSVHEQAQPGDAGERPPVPGSLGQPIEELPLSGETTECCGYGGLQANANPDLARRVAERRGNESPAEFVTYCAMCRDSLASTGKRAIHLLDLLFPGGPDPAARSRPGWSERRENRARLRERLLADLWREGGELMEAHEAVELVVSPEIQERLDERRILAEDVRKVIEHAERTGDKLCHQDSGRYLASFRPRAATFWVEYSPEGQGFRVHNAYAHRMTAELGVG